MCPAEERLQAVLLDAPARPRLLVVDDQAANIQVLYRVFEADHQVLMATDGEQALAAALRHQPDLILLDVVMPGMDGHTVCARLKASPDTRDIPVLFITAHSDPEQETKALAMGAVDFIPKPINPDVVRARVKTHLTLKRQADQLRHMAFMDGLTGTFNRRLFDDRLAMEWSRAVREQRSLGLALIDVDFFKAYNDHYGHQAGDDALVAVAGALKGAGRRPADVIARYGGEEFACLLPDTDVAGALLVANRMREAVFKLGLHHAGSSVAEVVTFSAGVAVVQPDGNQAPATLLKLADEQLYRAKALGRNQVCAPPGPASGTP
jgi:diguanylate cyclase (GGDEF)-like protein